MRRSAGPTAISAYSARQDQLVLQRADLRVELAGREPLRVEVEVAADPVGEAGRVGLVVDREARPVAEQRRLAAQDPRARGVEGRHPHAVADRADELGDPLAHLARGLVGERDREDLERRRRRARATRYASRCVSTRVLPEPAPATTRTGPGRQRDGLVLRRIQTRQIELAPRPARRLLARISPTGLGALEIDERHISHDRMVPVRITRVSGPMRRTHTPCGVRDAARSTARADGRQTLGRGPQEARRRVRAGAPAPAERSTTRSTRSRRPARKTTSTALLDDLEKAVEGDARRRHSSAPAPTATAAALTRASSDPLHQGTHGQRPRASRVTKPLFRRRAVQLPVAGEAVHLGAVQERRLAGGGVRVVALPRVERRGLQRAAVRERHLPRVRAELVDRVEVGGRLLVALAAGQEHDAGHRRGHDLAEARDRRVGDLRRATPGRPRTSCPGSPCSASATCRRARRAARSSVVEHGVQRRGRDLEQRSSEWSPSISTSGSTIGTMPSSWHSAA